MIPIESLKESDKGRKVIYRGDEEGVISSWNSWYIFVRFKGPGGAACNPEDLIFSFSWAEQAEMQEGGENE
jgi:hypothetical protein